MALEAGYIGASSSGRTPVFGAGYGGSNPSAPARENSRSDTVYGLACFLLSTPCIMPMYKKCTILRHSRPIVCNRAIDSCPAFLPRETTRPQSPRSAIPPFAHHRSDTIRITTLLPKWVRLQLHTNETSARRVLHLLGVSSYAGAEQCGNCGGAPSSLSR